MASAKALWWEHDIPGTVSIMEVVNKEEGSKVSKCSLFICPVYPWNHLHQTFLEECF